MHARSGGPRGTRRSILKAQSAASREARDEAARLRASGAALRQVADISGAELRSLLNAALAELDGAAEALSGSSSPAARGLAYDPALKRYTQRRLLQANFPKRRESLCV